MSLALTTDVTPATGFELIGGVLIGLGTSASDTIDVTVADGIVRATLNGQSVNFPAAYVAGTHVGRFAVLSDPQGAVFSIIRMNPRS